MNKLRNLKKGFSLVEIAIILVVIGVLFVAASSVIQGRSSAIEVSRTENRLKQVNDIILGSLKYTGFVPYITPRDPGILPGSISESRKYPERNFKQLVVMTDGYGNPFKYLHGRGTNNFYYYALYAPGEERNTNLCTATWSNFTLQFPDKTISNVVYLIYSAGKNGEEEIKPTTNLPEALYENGYIATIPLNNPNFDDKFMYATLEEVRSLMQCPMTGVDSGLQIQTKVLAMKKEGESLVDSDPVADTTVTKNIVYSNSKYAQWCVEVVADAGIDVNIAKKQIEVFRLRDTEKYIEKTEVIAIRDNGGCETEGNFTEYLFSNNSSNLQVVLNRNQAELKKGEYRYIVHVLDNWYGSKRRDKQIIKIRVPRDP